MKLSRHSALSLVHELSASTFPESNGDSEAAVKKFKLPIAHVKDKLDPIPASIANINYEQRLDGSECSGELFFQRSLRVPSLAMISTHTVNIDKEKECRAVDWDS